jgi:hypothetical protein
MRALVRRPLAFAILGLAVALSGKALAQGASAEPVEEVTVEGRKTMTQYRLEIERARDEVFRLYNEENKGTANDITCRAEQPTGSRMRQTVCRSEAEQRAHAAAARDFLGALFGSAGNYNEPGGAVDTQVAANIGTGVAQGDGVTGQEDALRNFEAEWDRLLKENRDLYRAVVKYSEVQAEYHRARGSATAAVDPALTVLIEEPIAPAQANGPQCEATTLTEYQQRNNVARVTGTVSIGNCPAGTTGGFTLVARVRGDDGEIKPLEFNETWQRADAQDHTFNTDYPIGDNVELMSVRVRGLSCTCAALAQ